MTDTEVPQRFSRQEGLAPHKLLGEAKCVVVGAGAVGRQVAPMLAAMGVGELVIYDDDVVNEVNWAPQMFRPDSDGDNKAHLVYNQCRRLNPDCRVQEKLRRFGLADHASLKDVWVFSCVDSMESRRLLWEAAVKGGARWFGDARCAGETVRVLAEGEVIETSRYAKPDVLFTDAEAHRGACATKMTVYSACHTASLLVASFAQYLRGVKQGFTDHLVSLLHADWSCPSAEADAEAAAKARAVPVEAPLTEAAPEPSLVA